MMKKSDKLGVAGWIAIVVMMGFLAAAIAYAVQVWTAMAGVTMSGWGWLFMILGVIVTTALGAGLMALVFYSSRNDMDR